MMRRKRKKSKIPDPNYERLGTLDIAMASIRNSPRYYPWRMKILHKGRTGIPRVIDQLVLDDYVINNYVSAVGNYVRERFGSGEFQVCFYDENDIERGSYTCRVGGAPEYIHPSDSDSIDWG